MPLCAAVAPLVVCFDCPIVTCEGQRWAFAKCLDKSQMPLGMGNALTLVFQGPYTRSGTGLAQWLWQHKVANAQGAVPKMHPPGVSHGRQMFLLVRINHYSSLGLKLGLVLVEGRGAPYHSSQDQRKTPFPPEMSGSHLPAVVGGGTWENSVLPPGEVRTGLAEGGAGAQCCQKRR